MKGASGLASCVAGVVFFGLAMGPVNAQSQRDPTLPPPGAGQPVGRPATATGGVELLEKGGYSIIVRDGTPFLAVGTRLYARGQKLGTAVIERISETEIWLREGRELRKISQFAGIQRRVVPAGAEVPQPACAASAPKTPSRAKIPAKHSSTNAQHVPSCANDQP